MRPLTVAATISVVLFIASCSSMQYDRLAVDYRQRSPVAEADSDFEVGDRRIYSAMGVGRFFPGLEPEVAGGIAAKHGERMIPGTTDAPEGEAQSRFIGAS